MKKIIILSLLVLCGAFSVSPAPQTKDARIRVGILGFAVKSGAPNSYAEITEELFRNAVVETGAFDVLDRNNMQEILKEQSFQQTGCTESECAVKIGKMLNMQYMLYGTIMKMDTDYMISVGMVNIETGKIERTAQDKFQRIDGVEAALKKIVANISSGRRRQVSTEMQPNGSKIVLLITGLSVGVVGGGLNGFGYYMHQTATDAQSKYTAGDFYTDPTMFDKWVNDYKNGALIGNILNISAYACYGISAGLLVWWLFSPDTIPLYTVTPTSDGIGFTYAIRF